MYLRTSTKPLSAFWSVLAGVRSFPALCTAFVLLYSLLFSLLLKPAGRLKRWGAHGVHHEANFIERTAGLCIFQA